MPIFEFKCKNCDQVFEEFLFSSNTESANIVCPKCGSENADKLMSAFSSSAGSGVSLGSGAASCGSSGFG